MWFKVTEKEQPGVYRVNLTSHNSVTDSVLLDDLPAIPKGSRFRLLTKTGPDGGQLLEFRLPQYDSAECNWGDLPDASVCVSVLSGRYYVKSGACAINLETMDLVDIPSNMRVRCICGPLILEEVRE